MFRCLEDGSPPPAEWRLMRYIDRFGVAAVMNRQYLGAGEMRRMIYCDNLSSIFDSMTKAVNVVTWQREHPDEFAVYSEAMKAAENGE